MHMNDSGESFINFKLYTLRDKEIVKTDTSPRMLEHIKEHWHWEGKQMKHGICTSIIRYLDTNGNMFAYSTLFKTKDWTMELQSKEFACICLRSQFCYEWTRQQWITHSFSWNSIQRYFNVFVSFLCFFLFFFFFKQINNIT